MHKEEAGSLIKDGNCVWSRDLETLKWIKHYSFVDDNLKDESNTKCYH